MFDSYIYNIHVILSGMVGNTKGKEVSIFLCVCVYTHAYTHIPISREGHGCIDIIWGY